MASSKNATAITWSSAAFITLNSASQQASDALTFNAEDWEGELQVWADNQGTPAAGDVVNVRIAYTVGDVLGDTGDDYVTNEHAEFQFQLDTYSTDTPGEDPASRSCPVRTGAKGFKVVVDAPQGASRNIKVYAMVNTHRPQ